jgi:uncharacterized repeat protein (TIGR03917 family)
VSTEHGIDFTEIENFANGNQPRTCVAVSREDDGDVWLTLGPGVTAADLAQELAKLPPGYTLMDVIVNYYNGDDDDCDGQDFMDEVHQYPIMTLVYSES